MSNTDTDPTQLDPNLGDSPEFLRRAQSNPLSLQQQPSRDLSQLDPNLGDSPEFLRRMQQGPRALPPLMGNFLENIGAFVPRDLSQPPQQGTPPPQWPPPFRENRRQMYVPSQANRPPTELGKPPTFPQVPDMWQVPGVYEGVGRQLGRWGGSQRTRMMAGNLSRYTNAYMQGLQRGQREYSREQYRRMTETADALQGMLQNDLVDYGAAYNTYGSDPQQLQSDLVQRATLRGDTEMQAALNTGPREAERLLQWRQAKYDDLSRSNTARRQHDENLRARNPWLIKPVGPDGLPTERLPLPKELDPNALSLGTPIQLAGAFPTPNASESAAGDPTIPKSYPQNIPEPTELQGGGGRLGPSRPYQPRPRYFPDEPPDPSDPALNPLPPEQRPPLDPNYKPGGKYDPNRQGDERFTDDDVEGEHQDPKANEDERLRSMPPQWNAPSSVDPRGEGTPERIPNDPEHTYPPRRRRDTPFDKASAPSLTQLAQADTGTMTDAPTLPQITVRPDDQSQEDEDGRTVWDDVRLRSQLREAREQGGTSGGPSDQPPSATGTQPPQPSPAGQPQGAAGGGRPGQPAGATAQAPDQSVPPQAATPAAQKPQAKAPAPGVSPATDAARTAGQDADFIEGFASQWAIGQQTTAGMSRSGIPKEEREAILRRGTEIRNKMFGIINDPNLKEGDRDAVFAAIQKENPQIAAEMRGIINGSITPKKDTPYWVYALAHKIDPGINETTFRGRANALKEHTTGQMGTNKMKLGTAMYHADRALKNLERLPNFAEVGGREFLRQIPLIGKKAADSMFPEASRILNEIQTDIDTLNNEYHNVMAYRGNGTLTERKDLNARMSLMEPNALRGTVTEMIEEMKGRNEELKRNFEVGYGGTYGKVMGNYNLTGNQEGASDDDRSYSSQGNRLLDQPRQGGGNQNVIPYNEYFK